MPGMDIQYKSDKKPKFPLSVSYHDDLIERLKDRAYAVGYLQAVVEDNKGEKDADKLFILALRNVAKAHGLIRRKS